MNETHTPGRVMATTKDRIDRAARERIIEPPTTAATHRPGPCGCRMERDFYVAPGLFVDRIHYCPTHAAAPVMLEALRGLSATLTTMDQSYEPQQIFNVLNAWNIQARAAIAQAEGK